MKKSQSKIAVDVVLLPPDEIMEKVIEVNQARIKTFENKIILDKQNCLPHISLVMGCIEKEDIAEIDTVLKDIADMFSPVALTISDIRTGTIPTGEKVSGFEIEKTKDIQLLHETVMNNLSQYFTYDVSLDTIYALPDQQVEEATTHWIKNYQKESSFEKFSPHITIGIGEVEGETCGMNFPITFNASKLALCHLGNYCTCREILLLHDLKLNDDANHRCTIIIPTYNRPDYLKRILNYYNEYAGNHKIIVADSSSDENKKSNKEFISSLSNLDILYLNIYSSEINMYHKIADALTYVDTKYCVLCADDDFVSPNGISQSVDFLEKNPDFAVAHGYYIRFYLKTDKKGKQEFCWIPIYLQKSNTSPDPKLRLYFNIAKFNPPFYAVHRKACLEMIFKESIKYTCDPRFDELLLSALPSIYGKMKRLNVFYAAREHIPTSEKFTCNTLEDYIKDGTYAEKYGKFRDCLVMHLGKMSQLDAKESKKVVDDAMSALMKRKYLTVKMIKVLDYLRLPDWLDRRIRALYRRLFIPKMPTDEDVPPSYYDGFNKIRLHVLSYSKK